MPKSPALSTPSRFDVRCSLDRDSSGWISASECKVLHSSIPSNRFPSSRIEIIENHGNDQVFILLRPGPHLRKWSSAPGDLANYFHSPYVCKLKGLMSIEGNPREYSNLKAFESELEADVGALVGLRLLRRSRHLGNASMVAQDRFVDSFVEAIKSR